MREQLLYVQYWIDYTFSLYMYNLFLGDKLIWNDFNSCQYKHIHNGPAIVYCYRFHGILLMGYCLVNCNGNVIHIFPSVRPVKSRLISGSCFLDTVTVTFSNGSGITLDN